MSGTDKQTPFGVYKCKEMIHDILLQSGQKDLLMTHVRHKSTQHGWTWNMRDEFMEYIKKRGSDNVNVSHMITDLAPLGRELFPNDLKKELLESMFEVTKNYFTVDDTITPITDPDNLNSEADKTFLYQSRDVKPDPGMGIGVEIPESPPPSPLNNPSASSTPGRSPGPVATITSTTTRQSPIQSTPRQSPGAAPRHSPASTAPRPLTPLPLPPPPVLRPETVSGIKREPVAAAEEEEEQEDEDDDDEEVDDFRNNEEEDDDEDELMDV